MQQYIKCTFFVCVKSASHNKQMRNAVKTRNMLSIRVYNTKKMEAILKILNIFTHS